MSASQWSLRPASDADEGFLYRLYESTRGQQFQLLPLPPEQIEALVRMQFNAQRGGYRQQYPASEDSIILVNGEPAGRVWLDGSSPVELHLLDIAILPKYQARGLGTEVVRQTMEEARAAGKTMSLHVSRTNVRAFDLYRRLGFEVTGGDEMNVEMKWQG